MRLLTRGRLSLSMSAHRDYNTSGCLIMKGSGFPLRVMVVVWLLMLSACFGPECGPQRVRIKTFTWDGTLYHARYNAGGRLVKLQGNTGNVAFLYDENNKLYKASINANGQPVPVHVYEFKHGPMGIRETRTYDREDFDGQLHLRLIQTIDYLTATKLNALIQDNVDQVGDSIYVTFHLYRRFAYAGNNVALVDAVPPFTEYRGLAYDAKANPFMMLAEAVGNPAFFPIGLYANFPVVDFNIPLLSVFSQNNPVKAVYSTVGGGIPSTQTFTNTYENSLVKKIVWQSTLYPDFPSDFRVFKFEYEWAPAL